MDQLVSASRHLNHHKENGMRQGIYDVKMNGLIAIGNCKMIAFLEAIMFVVSKIHQLALSQLYEFINISTANSDSLSDLYAKFQT